MQTMTEQKKRYTIPHICGNVPWSFFLRETGVYFDEHSEEEILYMNILQYGETLQISKITNWFQWEGWVSLDLRIYRKRSWQRTVLSVRTVINVKLEQHPEVPGCRVMYGMHIRMRCFSGCDLYVPVVVELFLGQKDKALLGTLMLFLDTRDICGWIIQQ